MNEGIGLRGKIEWDLWSHEGYKAHLLGDPLAIIGDLGHGENSNLVTRVGDEYYGERAAGIATPPNQVVGMQLGTGTATPAKSGVGSFIGTLVAASSIAYEAGYPTSALAGASRRIQWRCIWDDNVATSNGISEVVLHNQDVGTQTAVPESNTISRALILPPQDKLAASTLTIVWSHFLLGA